MENPILSNPKDQKCQFYIGHEKGVEFFCYPVFSTDVMHDALSACVSYLETGASAIRLDCSGAEYTVILTGEIIYILDDTELPQIHILNFGDFTPKNFCENVVGCYKEMPESWINLTDTGIPEENIEQCERVTRKNFDEMVERISKLLELL
ncbi:hypothetical protein [Blautia sp. 1033sp1_1033st1_G9_1033SCRN_220408]|uniref:hypothetical protein n=1 Tax=Blautia sp. 1033sp1_1033st1_G9_1033SCRN_220408 TaxID=3144490 RepID=UPI0034A5C2EA